jgi:hypothetical protein
MEEFMSIRKLGIVLAAVCAAALVVPVTAGAQTPSGTQTQPTTESVKSFKHIPVSGMTDTGRVFTGHFAVSQFVVQQGKTVAVGTLTGTVGQKSITQSNVAIPISVQRGTVSPAATCPILHLVLGPLHLNLLGLHVDLNKVILNITAVSGPGNLLGNLLCGVANLLNQTPLGTTKTAGLLNVVQQLTNIPGLLNL